MKLAERIGQLQPDMRIGIIDHPGKTGHDIVFIRLMVLSCGLMAISERFEQSNRMPPHTGVWIEKRLAQQGNGESPFQTVQRTE